MNNSLNEPEPSRSHTLYCKVKTPTHSDCVAADVKRLIPVPSLEFTASLRRLLQKEVSL